MAIDNPTGKIDPRTSSLFHDWLTTARAVQQPSPDIEASFPEIEDLLPEPVILFPESWGRDDPDELTSPTIP